jgi:hypothetical protein
MFSKSLSFLEFQHWAPLSKRAGGPSWRSPANDRQHDTGLQTIGAVRNTFPIRQARSDRALEILRERCARGDINKEEFEARRNDLVILRR